jgi:hypothetical protein
MHGLHNASRLGREELVQLLLEKGADTKAQDGNGCTALHKAPRYGHEAVAQLLLNSGAEASVKNRDGETALGRRSRSFGVFRARDHRERPWGARTFREKG